METKESKILAAAQKLFFRHGFKKVNMSDIAEAAGLSRPSLYAVFENKEAVINGIVKIHVEINRAETEKKLKLQKNLRDQLECLLDIWIVQPFAFALDSESGAELTHSIGECAPGAVDQIYKEFEAYVVEILKPRMKKKGELSAKDLAHILSMATKGIKASSETLPQLKRLVDGLVAMTLSMVDE